MVDIEFDDEPTVEDIEKTIGRIQTTGNIPRGISGGRALEYDCLVLPPSDDGLGRSYCNIPSD